MSAIVAFFRAVGRPGRARSTLGWWVIAALVAATCLLLKFLQVTRESVLRADAWRNATAGHRAAAIRCNALPVWREREPCLVRLNAELRAASTDPSTDPAAQSLSPE